MADGATNTLFDNLSKLTAKELAAMSNDQAKAVAVTASLLKAEEVVRLPEHFLIFVFGHPACRTASDNIGKLLKSEQDGLIGTMVPALFIPAQNGKPAVWNPKLDVDEDKTVEHHEVVAGLMRASEIAYARGVSLKEVKIEQLDCKELQPIAMRLQNKEGPGIC